MIENEEFKGFYNIPNFDNYCITVNGEILNKTTKLLLKGSKNPAGYINYRLKHNSGFTLTIGRHRVLCMVFKPLPENNYSNLIVNHKNGIKGDDFLDNLEWCTHQENCEHAGRMNLSKKCIPISVKDVDSGEIIKFPSIISCANYLKIHKDSLIYRLRFGENRIFPERKQYRLSHKDDPWYTSSNVDTDLLKNGRSKKVLLRYVKTGKVKEFKKLSDLAKYLKISPSTITLWINLKNQPILPGFIQIQRLDSFNTWRDPCKIKIEYGDSVRKKVRVVNHETKEIQIYNSTVECAIDNNLNTTCLNYRLKSNGSVIFVDKKSYEYFHE